MHQLVKVALSLVPVVLFLLSCSPWTRSSSSGLPRGQGDRCRRGRCACLPCVGLVADPCRVCGCARVLTVPGPLVEETAKVLFVAYLVRSRRVGFMVDAAILGFATGPASRSWRTSTTCGPSASPTFCCGAFVASGPRFSTAARPPLRYRLETAVRRAPQGGPEIFLPGLGIAVVAHALFNLSQLYLSPLVFTPCSWRLSPSWSLRCFHAANGCCAAGSMSVSARTSSCSTCSAQAR